jgi:hypothetical protein
MNPPDIRLDDRDVRTLLVTTAKHPVTGPIGEDFVATTHELVPDGSDREYCRGLAAAAVFWNSIRHEPQQVVETMMFGLMGRAAELWVRASDPEPDSDHRMIGV